MGTLVLLHVVFARKGLVACRAVDVLLACMLFPMSRGVARGGKGVEAAKARGMRTRVFLLHGRLGFGGDGLVGDGRYGDRDNGGGDDGGLWGDGDRLVHGQLGKLRLHRDIAQWQRGIHAVLQKDFIAVLFQSRVIVQLAWIGGQLHAQLRRRRIVRALDAIIRNGGRDGLLLFQRLKGILGRHGGWRLQTGLR